MAVATDVLVDLASAIVSSGGTTAVAAGTVETWTVTSAVNIPPVTVFGSNPTQFRVGDVAAPTAPPGGEICLVTNVALGTLTAALVSGTAYTSLSVTALPFAVAVNDNLVIGMGATIQTVVVSTAAASGATSIAVTSFTANAAYAVGSPVTDTTTPSSNGGVWTVTRGVEGTAPLAHAANWTAVIVLTSAALKSAIPAGPAGLVWMGPYDNTTTYAINDAVSYDGSSYIAIAGTTGVAPGTPTSPGTNWDLLAEIGATGASGSGGGSAGLAINVQTGTAYTTVLTDDAALVTMNNAAANVVTVPPNSSVAYPLGAVLQVAQLGAGSTSFAAGSGVTLDTASSLVCRTQYSQISATQVATNTWLVGGDTQ